MDKEAFPVVERLGAEGEKYVAENPESYLNKIVIPYAE